MTIDKLKDLQEVLADKEDITEIFLIQKIFKQLRGHEMIIKYIASGTSVCE